jgi:hypothetical protein
MRLVTGPLPRRSEFAPRSVHVGFVVDKVALGQAFLRVFRFPLNNIPQCFSILIYHLGDEQLARWWPQFRDTVSPHWHEQQQPAIKVFMAFEQGYPKCGQRVCYMYSILFRLMSTKHNNEGVQKLQMRQMKYLQMGLICTAIYTRIFMWVFSSIYVSLRFISGGNIKVRSDVR